MLAVYVRKNKTGPEDDLQY